MTERNAPCPCGSGRKYKHCCLREAQSRLAAPADRGPPTALGWLDQHFRKQVRTQIDLEFFKGIDLESLRGTRLAMDPGQREMLDINIGDFVLCDARYTRGDEQGSGLAWVLESGPRLQPTQRKFLEALDDAPLRLYEVVAALPGKGLELRDAIDPQRSPGFVTERTASATLAPGDVFGARVLVLPDHNELGGALYPLHRLQALEVMDQVERWLNPDLEELDQPEADEASPMAALDPEILAAIEAEMGREDSPEEDAQAEALAEQMQDECVAETIRRTWLEQLFAPRLPELVDHRGERLVFVEDEYTLRDATALQLALAACTDVVANDEGWVRLDGSSTRDVRILCSIRRDPSGRLVTLTHQTQSAADAGREWFRVVAGKAVRHRARRVNDLQDALQSEVDDTEAADDSLATGDLDPDTLRAAVEKSIHRIYAHWCEESIPVLGNRSPRECLGNERDRERVRFLLRSYEHAERDQARRRGREPVSYEFLWKRLQLAREE